MKCFVYRNIHRRMYSFKALEGPYKGRVVGHAPTFLMKNATFRVSEAGRQRVLATRTKNVHAGLVGDVICTDRWFELRFGEQPFPIVNIFNAPAHAPSIIYSPYAYPYFFDVKTRSQVDAFADLAYGDLLAIRLIAEADREEFLRPLTL